MSRRLEIYSKRLKRQQQSGKGDVYQYDTLTDAFRIQVVHIWRDAIGVYYTLKAYESKPFSNIAWEAICDSLTRELGVFQLADRGNPFDQCVQYIQKADTNEALDIIELTFRLIDTSAREVSLYEKRRSCIKQDPDDAIEELNHRFRENGIGYQFVSGEIVRVDSQYIHSEVVKPALELLNEKGFRGASDEFLKAHERYRHGDNKGAVVEALKAFESTMKAICDERGWKYFPSATAKPLIDVLIRNGLIPSDLESHFSGLRSALESGLPTIRNRAGGHGQGKEPISIPDYMASYALHLAASDIVFLVRASEKRESVKS